MDSGVYKVMLIGSGQRSRPK